MLKYATFKFNLEFETKAKLPRYKGDILRGALGKNLRDICCPLKHIYCNECILSSNCVYYSFFESKVVKSEKKSPNRPLPFIIEPFDIQKKDFLPKDKMSFNLILIQDSINFLPHITYSIINMGKRGIGFNKKQGFGKFKLTSILQGDNLIYNEVENKLIKNYNLSCLNIEEFNNKVSKIKIEFITPFRVKYRNKLAYDFDFQVIVRACLRRISQLEETYFGREPEIDYRSIVYSSKDVKKIYENKKWFEIPRYSFRQNTRMKLGGLIGEAIYEGDIGKFYPLLRYCEIVHIGKQTSFGFGKFKTHILE